jgi:hypothetical protein
MTEAQRIYCDGAAMAYRDVAAKVRQMIAAAPVEIKHLMEACEPLAISCENKAKEVYKEFERMEAPKQ